MTRPITRIQRAEFEDDRPIAVRRKRRSSSALADPKPAFDSASIEAVPKQHLAPVEMQRTPTKSKKRVRFSDPGPDSLTPTSSTGLTPCLKRAFLEHEIRSPSSPRLLAKQPRRRSSLPTLQSTSSRSSLPPSASGSRVIQFVPLRQALDDRLKRRLRRNNLSEEINQIDSEQKTRAQLKEELQALKDQLALEQQLGSELETGQEMRDNEKFRKLEEELANMKQEMRGRSTTAEPTHSGSDHIEPATSTSCIFDDGTDDDFLMVNFDDNGVLKEKAPPLGSPCIVEAGVQVAMPAPDVDKAFRSARMSLEYLFPGESPLGLTNEDPEEILNAILGRLHSLKAQTLVAEEDLAASRTQESNLRNQFNAVLQQLDRSRKYGEEMNGRIAKEQTNREDLERREQSISKHLEEAETRAMALEHEVDKGERSIRKLQDALDSYRSEVAKLEKLVTQMEADHGAVTSGLRAHMDGSIADLECKAAAETKGRQAAENEAVSRGERIKLLEISEKELKEAMSEKQQILRGLEEEYASAREAKGREMGVMNVTIGQLASKLEDANAELKNVEEERIRLLTRVEEEKAAGLKAVEAVQAEMAAFASQVEGVKETHVKDMQRRGAEVTEHRGLLTPVSACRFRDVEGYVETKRGKERVKKRPDSGIGIGIVEEDKDEDMMV